MLRACCYIHSVRGGAAALSGTTERIIAGWSSPVARQAHNLKVAGSNPAPATNFLSEEILRGFWTPQKVQKPRCFWARPKGNSRQERLDIVLRRPVFSEAVGYVPEPFRYKPLILLNAPERRFESASVRHSSLKNFLRRDSWVRKSLGAKALCRICPAARTSYVHIGF